MVTLISVLLLVAGAVLLTVGAEAFAEHAAAAASRLGVSVLAVAVLLAGAEPEEAVTAMLASGQGHPALAAGDAIGANLVILTLTLGVAALLIRLPVSRRVVEYAVAATVVGVLAVLFLRNGVLARVEGAVLVAAYVVGVVWVWRREHAPPVIGEMAEVSTGSTGAPRPLEEEETPRALLLMLVGLLAMVGGGYLVVRGAQGLVDLFDVTESVIGLTVLALATSAEMLALVWATRRRDMTEIAVAAVVGAVAYNASVSLGLAALVSPLGIGRGSPITTTAVLTAVLPLVLLAGRRTGTFPAALGAGLLATYVVAVGWLFLR